MQDLDQRLSRAVGDAVASLKDSVRVRLEQSTQDLLRAVTDIEEPAAVSFADDLAALLPEPEPVEVEDPSTTLHEAITQIDAQRAQADVLLALVEQAQRFGSRSAFLLTRGGEIQGWAGRGFGEGDDQFAALRQPFGDGSEVAALVAGTGPVHLPGDACASLTSSLTTETCHDGVLIPFVLRGQLGGALYADRKSADDRLHHSCLQILTHCAAQAIETLALRDDAPPSPTLVPLTSEEAGAGEQEVETPEVEPESLAEVEGSDDFVEVEAAEPDHVEATEPDHVETDEDDTSPGIATTIAGVATAAVAGAAAAVGIGSDEPAEVPEMEPVPEMAAVEPDETAAPAPEAPAEADVVPVGDPDEAVSEDLSAFEIESVDPHEAETATIAVGEVDPLDDHDIWEEDDADVGSPDPAFAAPPPETEPDPAIGQQTVRLDMATLESVDPAPQAEVPTWETDPVEPASTPSQTLDDTRPSLGTTEPAAPEPAMPELELDLPSQEPVTEPIDTPVDIDVSEDPTLMSRPAPAVVRDVPSAPEEPKSEAPAAGGSEVVPPMDVQGPGLAFAQAGSGGAEQTVADNAPLHEEAKRLARLLVSEIKLYNEEVIEEGRRENDIYARLKDDIDRSRRMYEERIDPRLRDAEDYFYQELLDRLAGGDVNMLGLSS